MTLNLGLVEVYTGNGKGKTTAALGLAMRAIGHGNRVLFAQFMKKGKFGEHMAGRALQPNLLFMQFGKPQFLVKRSELTDEKKRALGNPVVYDDGHPPQEYVQIIREGFEEVRAEVLSGRWDLVVLDEVNVAIHMGLLDKSDVLKLIKEKPKGVELVLTGRYADPDVMAAADLVTDMVEVKHPFQKGIRGRKGIEF
ncbi:MAG: cob(I)yrinic acid a,c-diamide adenosyltransferase [Thermoprotei archaeon]|jgi:cob(I)alamin adenosyltransferase